MTILLTTHVLEVAERLATHAGVIHRGRMADEGTLEGLKARHGVDSLAEVFERIVGAPASKGVQLSFYETGGEG